MALDSSYAAAQNEFDLALDILYDDDGKGAYDLMQEHISKTLWSLGYIIRKTNFINPVRDKLMVCNIFLGAWEKIWLSGSLEVEGDNLVSKVAAFAQYNLFSNFPSPTAFEEQQRDEHLFGIGRGSLGRGSTGQDARVILYFLYLMFVPWPLPIQATLSLASY